MIDLNTLTFRSAVEQDLSETVSKGQQSNLPEPDVFALRQFLGWHRLRFGCRPDAAEMPRKLAQFVSEMGQQPSRSCHASARNPESVDERLLSAGLKRSPGALSLVTLRRRVASIDRILSSPDGEPLGRSRAVLDAVARLSADRRRDKASSRDHGVDASPAALAAAVAGCEDSLVGLRDRAFVSVWAATKLPLLFLLRAGIEELVEALGRCEDQRQCDRARDLLLAWARQAKIKTGPLFRHVRPDGRMGAPMTRSSAEQMIRRRLESARLSPRRSRSTGSPSTANDSPASKP
ncbi:hypothetical protein [Ramlibacter sp.]